VDEVDSVPLADLAHLVGVARKVFHFAGDFAEGSTACAGASKKSMRAGAALAP
jgi:hypothetical protein